MPAISKDTEEGQEFSGKPKRVTWQRLWAFSGGPFSACGWPKKNIHTDPETAKNVGLPTVCASGTQCEGYIVELMIDLFGEGWLRNGELSLKFVKLVLEGDTVCAKGKIRSREESTGVKFALEVWCENQASDKVVVGTATGVLP